MTDQTNVLPDGSDPKDAERMVDDVDDDTSDVAAISLILTYDECAALAATTGADFWIAEDVPAEAISAPAGERSLAARMLAIIGADDTDLAPPLDTMIDAISRPERVVLMEDWVGRPQPDLLLASVQDDRVVSQELVEGTGLLVVLRSLSGFLDRQGFSGRPGAFQERFTWPPEESSHLRVAFDSHRRSRRLTLATGDDDRSLTLLDCGEHGLFRQMAVSDDGNSLEVVGVRPGEVEEWWRS